MSFITDTHGDVHKAEEFTFFQRDEDTGCYVTTTGTFEYSFEFEQVDRLLATFIPCTGEYMGVAAVISDEDESLQIVQLPVLGWRIAVNGAAVPVTPRLCGVENVYGHEIYELTEVLDVKSGKVYGITGELFDSLEAYKAHSLKVLKRRRRSLLSAEEASVDK